MTLNDVRAIYTTPNIGMANLAKIKSTPRCNIEQRNKRRNDIIEYLKEHGETKMTELVKHFKAFSRRVLQEDVTFFSESGVVVKRYHNHNKLYVRLSHSIHYDYEREKELEEQKEVENEIHG